MGTLNTGRVATYLFQAISRVLGSYTLQLRASVTRVKRCGPCRAKHNMAFVPSQPGYLQPTHNAIASAAYLPSGRSTGGPGPGQGARGPSIYSGYFLAPEQAMDPQYQTSVDTFQLPAAFLNKHNPYLTQVLHQSLQTKHMFLATTILPFTDPETVNLGHGLSITWNTFTADSHALNRLTSQTTGSITTESVESHSRYMEQHGLSFLIEAGFMTSELGRNLFARKIKQIKDALMKTVIMECLRALINTTNVYATSIRTSKTGGVMSKPQDYFGDEFSKFGCINKEGLPGLTQRFAVVKSAMSSYNRIPDAIILAPGTTLMAKIREKRPLSYLLPGSENDAFRDREKATPMLDEASVHEVVPITIKGVDAPIADLTRTVCIGQYFAAVDHTHGYNNYQSHWRDIAVFDQEENDFSTISLRDMIFACGRWRADGSLDTKTLKILLGRAPIGAVAGNPYDDGNDQGGSSANDTLLWKDPSTGESGIAFFLGQLDESRWGDELFASVARSVSDSTSRFGMSQGDIDAISTGLRQIELVEAGTGGDPDQAAIDAAAADGASDVALAAARPYLTSWAGLDKLMIAGVAGTQAAAVTNSEWIRPLKASVQRLYNAVRAIAPTSLPFASNISVGDFFNYYVLPASRFYEVEGDAANLPAAIVDIVAEDVAIRSMVGAGIAADRARTFAGALRERSAAFYDVASRDRVFGLVHKAASIPDTVAQQPQLTEQAMSALLTASTAAEFSANAVIINNLSAADTDAGRATIAALMGVRTTGLTDIHDLGTFLDRVKGDVADGEVREIATIARRARRVTVGVVIQAINERRRLGGDATLAGMATRALEQVVRVQPDDEGRQNVSILRIPVRLLGAAARAARAPRALGGDAYGPPLGARARFGTTATFGSGEAIGVSALYNGIMRSHLSVNTLSRVLGPGVSVADVRIMNANMARRLAYVAQRLTDPVQRACALTMLFLPINRDSLINLYDTGCRVPFNFLLFRPYISLRTATAIFCVAGRETGMTLVKNPTFRLGEDVELGVYHGKYSVYLASVVTSPENVRVEHDVEVRGVNGGYGTKLFDRHHRGNKFGMQGRGTQPHTADIFSCLVGANSREFESILDITGQFHNDVPAYKNMDGLPHYESAPYYQAYWGFRESTRPLSYGRDDESYSMDSRPENTICPRGSYQRVDPANGSMRQSVIGCGHMENCEGPGAGIAMTKGARFVRYVPNGQGGHNIHQAD